MLAFNFFGATEGGLFDINATLPLMAIQVVALTYICLLYTSDAADE